MDNYANSIFLYLLQLKDFHKRNGLLKARFLREHYYKEFFQMHQNISLHHVILPYAR